MIYYKINKLDCLSNFNYLYNPDKKKEIFKTILAVRLKCILYMVVYYIRSLRRRSITRANLIKSRLQKWWTASINVRTLLDSYQRCLYLLTCPRETSNRCDFLQNITYMIISKNSINVSVQKWNKIIISVPRLYSVITFLMRNIMIWRSYLSSWIIEATS